MLYQLLYPLHRTYSALNVFRYISFRTLVASLTALVISLWLGKPLIRKLSELRVGQHIRDDGPERHKAKAGTPTMGGTLILFSSTLATLLLADLGNPYVWLTLFVLLGFGAIGFVDDYRKLRGRSSAGLSARGKLLLQFAIAVPAALFLALQPEIGTEVVFPVFKDLHPALGWWYVPFAALLIVGTSNAVNLTDGLDGLAGGASVLAFSAFIVIGFWAFRHPFNYGVPHALDLSSPNMAASVNAALKPLETLSKIVNQPSRQGPPHPLIFCLVATSSYWYVIVFCCAFFLNKN